MFKVLTANNNLVNNTGKFPQCIQKLDDSTDILQLNSTRKGLLVVVDGENDPDLRDIGNCICPLNIQSALLYYFSGLRVV